MGTSMGTGKDHEYHKKGADQDAKNMLPLFAAANSLQF
jgi:hypothetical protein